MNRKELKRNAKHSLKKHFVIFVFACLIASFLGAEFGEILKVEEPSSQTQSGNLQSGAVAPKVGLVDVIEDLAYNSEEEVSKQVKEQEEKEASSDTNKVLGHRRGVLAKAVNSITSGSIVVTVFSGIRRIVKSKDIVIMILIVISLLVVFLFWLLVTNVYQVIMRRIFLEGYTYDKVPIQRFMFLRRVKKWIKASLSMMRYFIYLLLWSFTIIGGVIKVYSYLMVPYIVAENPNITGKQAIYLSRHMMKGHKWECFVVDLSFLGWQVLNLFTVGLLSVLFINPYKTATFTQYYVQFRKEAKDNNLQYSELLNDEYLYIQPEKETVKTEYNDAVKLQEEVDSYVDNRKGLPRFLSNVFGISLSLSAEENKHYSYESKKVFLRSWKDIIDGKVYPARLNPIREKEKIKKVTDLNYLRSYTICSIVLIFFVMAFVGWVWEVSLHLVTDGVFVNRGVLHGPWLPIYGTGSVLILIVLNKMRKNMAVEFICAVVLCGIVEYGTSWYLQMAHNGQKWWDYSGYFLNINGRVCAEGLLVFGLGGIVIVYVLAPFIDNFVRKLPGRIAIPICVALLGAFGIDQVYSSKHPNTGKGITDYAKMEVYKS